MSEEPQRDAVGVEEAVGAEDVEMVEEEDVEMAEEEDVAVEEEAVEEEDVAVVGVVDEVEVEKGKRASTWLLCLSLDCFQRIDFDTASAGMNPIL